jgi:hypothetical protein
MSASEVIKENVWSNMDGRDGKEKKENTTYVRCCP